MEVSLIALEKITEYFDQFISECLDENGKPKAPSMRALMLARGCLPSKYKNTLVKSEK